MGLGTCIDSFQTWRAVLGISILFWAMGFIAASCLSKEPLKAQLACCNAGIVRNDASQKHGGVHFIQQPWEKTAHEKCQRHPKNVLHFCVGVEAREVFSEFHA